MKCPAAVSRADKTLAAVFADPARANIDWRDIESMLISLGAQTSTGSGSRVKFFLNGVRVAFHKPHPQTEAGRGSVLAVRRFLVAAGVKP